MNKQEIIKTVLTLLIVLTISFLVGSFLPCPVNYLLGGFLGMIGAFVVMEFIIDY